MHGRQRGVATPQARICVAKIGGSLLSTAGLPERLRAWLEMEAATHPDTHYVLLVGGGRLVEAVREIDARSPLGQAGAHKIAIRLMDVTTELMGVLLPTVPVVGEWDALERRVGEPGASLFCPSQFLADVEPACRGVRLPASWDVTSDSIAGRLAVALGAGDLVLVKSARPPGGRLELDLTELAISGYVDPFLPRLAAELPPWRVVNLR